MVRHAARQGLHPMICTNGSLWTRHGMEALARDGLKSVIMSVDAHDAAVHENNRGLRGVCAKLRDANEVFARLGVQTTASVTVSRLIEDFEKLPAFLESLGFESCTFSYPLTHLGSGYLSYSESGLVRYSRGELLDLFDKIIRLKGNRDVAVVNPTESLREMKRHLRGERELFPCLGGHRYFHLDWNLQVYRCHQWESPMCHIREWNASRIIRDDCTRCMIDCYRDPSVLQFSAIRLADAWGLARRGRLIRAAGHLFDKRNGASLKAVWEDRRWIRKI
jgi:MoaA/NifB/PqqE/SkfB family radical SAM enzyme